MQYGLFFAYIRDAHNHPTVALAILTAPNSSKVNFQIATRNRKDNFSKKIARSMAGGRLAKMPVIFDMGKPDSKQSDIVNKIVELLLANNFAGVKAGPTTREVFKLYKPYVDVASESVTE